MSDEETTKKFIEDIGTLINKYKADTGVALSTVRIIWGICDNPNCRCVAIRNIKFEVNTKASLFEEDVNIKN